MHIKVGDLVVYPAHGVGRVESVEEKPKNNDGTGLVVLRILDNGMQIMIPARNLKEVGLRRLITKKEVNVLYEQLKQPPVIMEASNWNRRHRHYLDKLKTGAISDVCDVLRELMTMRGEKELSFGERKLLDTARALLIKEVAMVTNRNEERISQELDSFFPPPKASTA
ncbi:MAG: CarD family transcriptional regulator [Deltaproteobacteria bacterium]|jgi:CarD family transcriptional regulator|nr:CarD family transcriptional regulator [Deltaproteobacteria bacterium]